MSVVYKNLTFFTDPTYVSPPPGVTVLPGEFYFYSICSLQHVFCWFYLGFFLFFEIIVLISILLKNVFQDKSTQ